MQASLTQTRPPPAQLTRLAQQTGQPQQQQQQTLTGPGAGMPGLQNQIGEYNCFLNVVVQCLWHCRDFKRQFSSLAQENPAIVQVRHSHTLPAPNPLCAELTALSDRHTGQKESADSKGA